jgi:cytochrome c-type biogenesis protein CcmH
MTISRRALFALAFAASVPALSAAEEVLADPELERRARALMSEVRCVVCQSQSIGESDSEIAADMRRLIRERIAGGASDAEILDYLASRYGDFIRFKPPFKAATWALWVGPFAALGLAILVGFGFLRRRRADAAAVELDVAERARLDRLLREGIGERDGEGA